jgi:hypothetical protein
MTANFATLSGYYFPYNIFDYAPTLNNAFWQTTAGSPTLSYVNGSGTALSVPSGITTSSKVLSTLGGYTIEPGLPFAIGTKVNAVNSTSLTMSGNATLSGWWTPTPGLCRVA